MGTTSLNALMPLSFCAGEIGEKRPGFLLLNDVAESVAKASVAIVNKNRYVIKSMIFVFRQ
jgi:hypothetical protein